MKEENSSGKSQVTATIELISDPTDNGFKLAATMEVAIEGKELTETKDLADKAHAFCPYSKATKGNMDVTVKAVEYKKEV